MTIKLWELSQDLEAIGEEIAANGGELTPELEARLEELDGSFDEKVERVGLYICQLQASAGAAKTEKDRLAAIQKRYDSEAKSLKAYLLRHLEHHGKARVETAKIRVRVQASAEAVRWTGGQFEIPDNYKVTTFSFDRAQAKADRAAGLPLPAGIEFSKSTHLRIS